MVTMDYVCIDYFWNKVRTHRDGNIYPMVPIAAAQSSDPNIVRTFLNGTKIIDYRGDTTRLKLIC
jgi:hypothetical protein